MNLLVLSAGSPEVPQSPPDQWLTSKLFWRFQINVTIHACYCHTTGVLNPEGTVWYLTATFCLDKFLHAQSFSACVLWQAHGCSRGTWSKHSTGSVLAPSQREQKHWWTSLEAVFTLDTKLLGCLDVIYFQMFRFSLNSVLNKTSPDFHSLGLFLFMSFAFLITLTLL